MLAFQSFLELLKQEENTKMLCLFIFYKFVYRKTCLHYIKQHQEQQQQRQWLTFMSSSESGMALCTKASSCDKQGKFGGSLKSSGNWSSQTWRACLNVLQCCKEDIHICQCQWRSQKIVWGCSWTLFGWKALLIFIFCK